MEVNAFWIFTEGSKKFIGLSKNDNVSLAVFDNNPNFATFKSVQIAEKAEIVEPESSEYAVAAEFKNIPLNALKKLADARRSMYLIKIIPTRMYVLFSEFKTKGYDSRQVLDFDFEKFYT